MTDIFAEKDSMTRMHAMRLARHVRFMRGVPRRGFNLGSWYSTGPDDEAKPPKRQDATCGATACIAGWLVVSEPKYWVNSKDSRPYLRKGGSRHMSQHYASSWPATDQVANVFWDFGIFFGMTKSEAEYICDPAEYLQVNSWLAAWQQKSTEAPTKGNAIKRMIEVARNHGWDIRSGYIKKIKVKPPTVIRIG